MYVMHTVYVRRWEVYCCMYVMHTVYVRRWEVYCCVWHCDRYAVHQTPMTEHSHNVPLLSDRTVISQTVQKKLYWFLRHAFDRWPLDCYFRMVSTPSPACSNNLQGFHPHLFES